MTTYLPTLKQLQYLVALRDHGHFGRAADACFVTQSTLSAGLRELESLIGIVLVERTRRVVRFTPLGLRIADKAQRVLREAEELGDMARAAGKPLSGELRMARDPDDRAVPAAAHAAAGCAREWPELKLYLREETSRRRLRRAAPRPCRLRAARPALPLRRRGGGRAVRRSAVGRLPGAASCRRRRAMPRRGDRRDPAAAARGRPLPEGSCARRLQPARTARRGGDARHLAAHARADGRQRPRRHAAARRWRSTPASSTIPTSSPARSMPTTRRAGSRWPGARASRAIGSSACSPMRCAAPIRAIRQTDTFRRNNVKVTCNRARSGDVSPQSAAIRRTEQESFPMISKFKRGAFAAAILLAVGGVASVAGEGDLSDGRRRRHVSDQEHRRECRQFGRSHHAGRRREGRRPGRYAVRPRPVHRLRADQRRLRQAARRHRRHAGPAREQGHADLDPHLPCRSRQDERQGSRRRRSGRARARPRSPPRRAAR